ALHHLDPEWQPKASAFAAFLYVALQPVASPTLGLALRVIAPVDAVHRAYQGVKRFFRDAPTVGEVETVHHRIRLLNIDEIAHAFHIGLSGQHPQITHQDVVDRGDGVSTLHAHFDTVGATRRNTDEIRRPVLLLDLSGGNPIEVREDVGGGG